MVIPIFLTSCIANAWYFPGNTQNIYCIFFLIPAFFFPKQFFLILNGCGEVKNISHSCESKSRKLGNPTFTCILIVISEIASWFCKACWLFFKHVWLFSCVPESSSHREVTEFAQQNPLSHRSKGVFSEVVGVQGVWQLCGCFTLRKLKILRAVCSEIPALCSSYQSIIVHLFWVLPH